MQICVCVQVKSHPPHTQGKDKEISPPGYSNLSMSRPRTPQTAHHHTARPQRPPRRAGHPAPAAQRINPRPHTPSIERDHNCRHSPDLLQQRGGLGAVNSNLDKAKAQDSTRCWRRANVAPEDTSVCVLVTVAACEETTRRRRTQDGAQAAVMLGWTVPAFLGCGPTISRRRRSDRRLTSWLTPTSSDDDDWCCRRPRPLRGMRPRPRPRPRLCAKQPWEHVKKTLVLQPFATPSHPRHKSPSRRQGRAGGHHRGPRRSTTVAVPSKASVLSKPLQNTSCTHKGLHLQRARVHARTTHKQCKEEED